MKAEELRIGNWIDIGNGQHQQVIAVMYEYGNDDYTVHYKREGAPFVYAPLESDIKPIPLNEEWLLKFGFQKGIHQNATIPYIIKNGWTFKIYYSVPQKMLFYLNHPDIHAEIQYVHQLQNLYFALTGVELTPTSTS